MNPTNFYDEKNFVDHTDMKKRESENEIIALNHMENHFLNCLNCDILFWQNFNACSKINFFIFLFLPHAHN